MPVMRNAGGYVRVFRSIVDWEWYHDDRCVRLFLHLLVKSNWTEGHWKGKPVEPGQMITSSVKLAEQLGWTRSAVVRTLDKLKSTGELDIQSNNHWTLITLANWEKYQGEGAEPDSKPINKRTTIGQPLRQPPDTIEEGKQEKKGNRETRVVAWPKWAGPNTLAKWEEFKSYRQTERKERYKSTETEQRAVNLLAKWFRSGQECVDALDEAMGRGWLFPVDPSKRSGPSAPATPPVVLNANGKPQQLKPWVN